jgi:glucose/arabinose dehydrogenase
MSRQMSLFRIQCVYGFVATAAISALPFANAKAQVYESQHHDFRVVSVAEGLENPWSMAWLPNGDMLVTERPGRVRIIRNGVLLADAVPGVPAVRAVGQGGLQDVVVHPEFGSNRLIYLSYAKPNADGSEGVTTVIRGRFENDRLSNVEEIFEAKAWSARPGHYGARMAFDAEGYLFLTSGDRMAPPAGDLEGHPAQDTMTHAGSVIRLQDDGRVPADNPFVGRSGYLPEIWSYGHRNPQGLAFDAETGVLWATEHGPQGGDELNQIRPGLNYGWPVIGYGVNYNSGLPIHNVPARDGMEQPAAFWVPSIAASGLMVYQGDKFPMWKGNIFAGGMSAQHERLSRLTIEGTTVSGREPLMAGDFRIRDVREGPDGYIYLAVDHRLGQLTPIVRLEPVAD